MDQNRVNKYVTVGTKSMQLHFMSLVSLDFYLVTYEMGGHSLPGMYILLTIRINLWIPFYVKWP